jgi:hypothetical protein
MRKFQEGLFFLSLLNLATHELRGILENLNYLHEYQIKKSDFATAISYICTNYILKILELYVERRGTGSRLKLQHTHLFERVRHMRRSRDHATVIAPLLAAGGFYRDNTLAHYCSLYEGTLGPLSQNSGNDPLPADFMVQSYLKPFNLSLKFSNCFLK